MCSEYVSSSSEPARLSHQKAVGTTTRFFDRTREAVNQTPDANRKRTLEDLLNLRDQITGELARGDPGALNDLQTLLVKTRQATAAPTP